MNLYTYCYSNPLNFTDPSGNIPLLIHLAYWYVMTVCNSPDTQQDIQYLIADIEAKDWVAAAFDIVGILVPGGTGYGNASKTVKNFVNKLLDFTGASNPEKYFDDIIRATNKVDDFSKGTNLSSNLIKHINNNHNANIYAEQLLYKPKSAALKELKYKTFFNSKWSKTQIENAVNLGYNQAISMGITTGRYEFKY